MVQPAEAVSRVPLTGTYAVPLRLNVGRTDGVLPEEIDHRRLRKSSEMKNVSKVLTSLFAIAALCMGLATSAGASTNSKPWTGLGATLSNWKLAHPANNTACTKGAGCYGPSIGQNNPSGQKAEFIGVELRNNRVSSFDFATGVVPASTAKSEVLKLLPSDTKTTASWVEHDSTGDTCLMWNLSSKTLEGWLGSKIDPNGEISVELENVPTNPNSTLASNSATQTNDALVGYGTELRSYSC